jgi:hypothetical protein
MKQKHMGRATLGHQMCLRVMTFAVRLAAVSLLASAFSSAATAQTNPTPRADSRLQPPVQAPVGHRQPRPQDLPSSVTRREGGSTDADRAIDKKLEICRGC